MLFGKWFVHKLKALSESVRAYRHAPGALSACFGLSLLTLIVRILMVKLQLLALGEQVGIMSLAAVMPLAWLAVMLPVSVGGFGLQEAVYVVALARLGVSTASALCLSIIDHVLTRVISLPGLFWFLRHGISATAKQPPMSVEASNR